MDFQNAIQGSGGNAQPLRHSNIVFYGLVNFVPADNQHMAPAQKFTPNVNAVLVFGRNGITQEMGKMKLISNIFPAPTIYRWQAAQFVSPDSPAYSVIEPYFLPLWIVALTVFVIGAISYLAIVKIYSRHES